MQSDGRVYGPGGQGVYSDSTLGLIIYYHYANVQIGLSRSEFQFGWNNLCFDNDWPSVCDPGNEPQQLSQLVNLKLKTPGTAAINNGTRPIWNSTVVHPRIGQERVPLQFRA